MSVVTDVAQFLDKHNLMHDNFSITTYAKGVGPSIFVWEDNLTPEMVASVKSAFGPLRDNGETEIAAKILRGSAQLPSGLTLDLFYFIQKPKEDSK